MLKNKALGKDKINWGYQPKLRLNCCFHLFAGQIIRICWTFPFTQKISLSIFCESSPISDSGDIPVNNSKLQLSWIQAGNGNEKKMLRVNMHFFLNCVKRDKE